MTTSAFVDFADRDRRSHPSVVPMLKDDELIGVIAIYRQEVRRSPTSKSSLLSNFARRPSSPSRTYGCLTSCANSLQQQTATADVLKVISRSTFDLQVVLDTLVELAARLCEADGEACGAPEGATFYLAASHGHTDAWKTSMQQEGLEAGRESITGRVLLEGKTVQIHDVQADPEYTISGTLKITDNRTILGVPLLREGTPSA